MSEIERDVETKIMGNKNQLKSSFNNGRSSSSLHIVKTPTRTDKYGNVISKKSKTHKVSFTDQIDRSKKIAEIARVKSYREFNRMEDSN